MQNIKEKTKTVKKISTFFNFLSNLSECLSDFGFGTIPVRGGSRIF
jgi:hypothetical protein